MMFNFDLDFDIDKTKVIELEKLLGNIDIIKKNNEIQHKIMEFVTLYAVHFCVETNELENIYIKDNHDTQQVLEDYLNTHKIDFEDKTKTEIINSYQALKLSHKHFEDKYSESSSILSIMLTPNEIQEFHEKLMKGIIINGGQFRKSQAFTYWKKEMYIYYDHSLIEINMFNLCDLYNDIIIKLSNLENKLELITKLYKLASKMMFYFLNIHPFGDGNGRCGRIILNHILSYIFPFPINILGSKLRNRDEYIDDIIVCRNHKYNHPINMVNGLIENSVDMLNIFFKLLNININDMQWTTCVGTIYGNEKTLTKNNIIHRYSILNHKIRYDFDKINKDDEINILFDEILKKNNKILLSKFAYVIFIYL